MNYVQQKLGAAIQTMREACDEAECAIKDDIRSDVNKINRVIHSLSWGFANSNTGIESALNQIERDFISSIED